MEADLNESGRNAGKTERYRLNRRAALSVSAVFLTLAALAVGFCMYRMQPQRRIAALRDNADRALQAGDRRRAAIELGNLVRLTPEDADAWLRLARVHLGILESLQTDGQADAGRDRLRLAAAAFRRAAELRPELPEPQRWLLELNLRGGNWTDARCRLDILQKLAPADPLVDVAWELLPTAFLVEANRARQALAAGNYQIAADALEPLLDSRPADLDLLEIHVQAAVLNGRAQVGQIRVGAARKLVGESPRLDLIVARGHWLAGDLDQAESFAERAKAGPHVVLAARRLRCEISKAKADLALAAGAKTGAAVHWNRAVAELREILEHSPLDQEAAIELAWLLGAKLGRLEEAAATTSAMLERTQMATPRLLDAHGWLLGRLGRNPAQRGSIQFSDSFWPGVSSPAVATGDDGRGGGAVRLVRSTGEHP